MEGGYDNVFVHAALLTETAVGMCCAAMGCDVLQCAAMCCDVLRCAAMNWLLE
jgi:hypothetical protein